LDWLSAKKSVDNSSPADKLTTATPILSCRFYKERDMNTIIWPHPAQFNNFNPDIRYQNWLRNDHSRELAYRLALEDIRKNDPNIKNILDAGTGSGVWAITAATIFRNASVLGIDMYEENVRLAKEIAKGFPTMKNRLRFETKNILELHNREKYDLIITELDGGVGNNEGAKRYFNKLQKLLSPNGIILPINITTFVVPIELRSINRKDSDVSKIPFLDYMGSSINDIFSSYYVVYGTTSGDFLSRFMVLDTIHTTKPIPEGYEKKLKFTVTQRGRFSGFLIWFVHDLTKNVKLSSHPDELPTTWGNAYFPIKEVGVKRNDEITLIFHEVITELYSVPYYIWKVLKNGILIGEYSNEETQKRRAE
jgi:ubiquinone/menaquinone biosynthesis C-methylase UbiE